jgi:acetyl esterase
MHSYRSAILLFLSIFLSFNGYSQQSIMYKEVDTTKLYMDVYYPATNVKSNRTAIVFFFGGGWTKGDKNQFLHQAEYFTSRGAVCFLPDYRTQQKNKTTPFECVKDAKSVIRFIRSHANDFKIDPVRIVASGGSAGGHLAAATALIDSLNEKTDNRSISCIPNALVLFNPVIDNGPGGYGFDRIGKYYKDFSPLHNIKKGAPPAIIFLGTKDQFIPVSTAEYFKTVMEKVGSRCDLKLYEGQVHGFFNYEHFQNYKSTIPEADRFLQSIGFLSTEPIISIE